MLIINCSLLIVTAYLLGSIPSAVWISRAFFGKDVRTLGSGNAGSTNMFRNFGAAAGIACQVIDIGKAMLAAALPWILARPGLEIEYFGNNQPLELQMLLTGLVAVVGHIYPVFAGFKGGKGINCLLGTMLVVNPAAAGICLLVFVATLLLSKYVSLSSMLGTLSFPVFVLIRDLSGGEGINWLLAGLGLCMLGLVCFTHRENIGRLLKGQESKAGFLTRKKKA
ncbi:MAG: glycerol-3-phosphate 1-O-acyltransferase PlsY [Bacteroidia bacterium]|nr:glycerol-3-phosphate 1-O-acyltransferase PlsY [Bacteroidia bacterium]